jgi:hypothetical protein
MFKTHKPLSIPLNLNMGLILSKILGVPDRYKSLVENTTVPFRDEYTPNPIPFKGVKLKELDRIIRINDYSKKKIQNDKSGITKFINVPKKFMGEIIIYKGYKVGVNDEKIKRVIDTRETLFNVIEKTFLSSLLGKINNIKSNNTNGTKFVFPYLSNDLFDNIKEDNQFNRLSIEQYKNIKHNTINYNRNLKKVQEICGVETSISSHVSRHTYTNLLLMMDNVNLYDVSQSLGHSNIKVTENYIKSGFNIDKIDYLNKSISKKYSKNEF